MIVAPKDSKGRKMVEVTQQAGRDWGSGGRHQSLTLQVRSPYGGMFACRWRSSRMCPA